MITLFRIDDRLIHGQVAMAWSRAAKADVIIAVDNTAANNKVQKMALMMAKPSGVDVEIVDTKNFLDVFNNYKHKNVMLVVGNPIEAKTIIDDLDKDTNFAINLGNLKSGEKKERISESIYVTPEEKDLLNQIKNMGIKIFIQGTPTSKKVYY